MTREEILDYFKDINFMYNNPSMFDTLKRMLDELIEPCEDCISKEDVMQILWDYDCTNEDALMVKAIKGLPSVQPTATAKCPPLDKDRKCHCGFCPERPKGEWQAVDGAWACSKCGCNSNNDGAFCQWCGADMRGEQE